MNHTLLVTAFLAGLPSKAVVAPLVPGQGANLGMTKLLGDAVAAELRRVGQFEVLTRGEFDAVLGHEQRAQLLGCEGPKCFADIGQAAGASLLVAGSLGKLGASWMCHLQLIDVQAVRVVSSADRRIKNGTVDDILDALPGMVGELVNDLRSESPGQSPDKPSAMVPYVKSEQALPALPPAFEHRPFDAPFDQSTFDVITDSKGGYLTFPREWSSRGPVFFGNKELVSLQRVYSSGRSGDSWNFSFWDPRFSRGTFSYDKDKRYFLTCGDKKMEFARLGDVDRANYLTKVKREQELWQRYAWGIARDDRGNYFYIDHKRKPKGNRDYRMFVGSKGRMLYLPLSDVIIDSNSSMFISSRGRLVFNTDEEKTVEWLVGDSKSTLTAMNVAQQGAMIYRSLGVYTGQALGTPCTAYVGK